MALRRPDHSSVKPSLRRRAAKPTVENENATHPAQAWAAAQRQPAQLSSQQALSLQRTVGNRAVQQLLPKPKVQAKLTVGAANDPYEQEAERVADQVMAGSTSAHPNVAAAPAVQASGAVQRMTAREAVGLFQSGFAIRSANGPADVGGAAFALIPRGYDPMELLMGGTYSTTTFYNQLRATCQFIKNYPGADGNHFLILRIASKATGGGYEGTLDKYNSAAGSTVLAHTTIAGHTADELFDYVLGNLAAIRNLTPDEAPKEIGKSVDEDDKKGKDDDKGSGSKGMGNQSEVEDDLSWLA